MIEFYGELTSDCKKYILKREAFLFFICILFGALLISIPLVIFIIYNHDYWGFIFIPIVAILLSLVPFCLKDKGMKNHLGMVMPTRVTIDNDGEMISESDSFRYLRAVSQVKIVNDMGEWYVIKFYYEHRNLRFICQKSLINQGTLEEFEKLFDGKIIKK